MFAACGFNSNYIKWLEAFVGASGIDNRFDYESFNNAWSGWGSFNNSYDWGHWSQLHEYLWNEYENSGWYDRWYDSHGGGWHGYFY